MVLKHVKRQDPRELEDQGKALRGKEGVLQAPKNKEKRWREFAEPRTFAEPQADDYAL